MRSLFDCPMRIPAVTAACVAIALLFTRAATLSAQTLPEGTMWIGTEAGWAFQSTFRPIMSGVADVAEGNYHLLVLKTDGTLCITGKNGQMELGQPGVKSLESLTQIASGVKAIAASDYGSYFVKDDGTLWVAGTNIPVEVDPGLPAIAPEFVQIAENVEEVSAGHGFVLVRKTDNTVWGTGAAYSGQLGKGSGDSPSGFIQIEEGAKAIATGFGHTLVLKQDGSLWGAGSNEFGQLGLEDSSNFMSFAQIATEVKAMAAGPHHTAFVKNDGTLWTCGANSEGQIGDGTLDDRRTPHPAASDVVSVGAGPGAIWFIKSDATLWATGGQDFQGNGAGSAGHKSPVQIATGAKIARPVGGTKFYLDTDDVLWGAGYPVAGELGDRGLTPEFGHALDSVSLVATNGFDSWVVKPDGTLWSGALPTLAQVPGVTDVKEIAAGASSSSAYYLKTDHTLWRIARGEKAKKIDADVRVISAGSNYVAYIKSDDTLWGWQEFYSIGVDFGPTNTPVKVAAGVRSVSAAAWHMLYVKNDNTLWGMGYPWLGFTNAPAWGSPYRSNPVELLTGIKAAAAHSERNAYISTDGSLWVLGAGFSDSAGPAVRMDTGVSTVAVTDRDVFYKKADDLLYRNRTVLHPGVQSFTATGWPLALIQRAQGLVAPTAASPARTVKTAVGASLILDAAFSGSAPISFRWEKDEEPVDSVERVASDRLTARLTVPYVQETSTGSYRAIGRNTAGEAVSEAVAIALVPGLSVSSIPDQVIELGAATEWLPFQLSNGGSESAIVLSAESSNPDVIPVENISFAGAGAARSVRVQATDARGGVAVISVLITDGGETAVTQFVVGVNGPPSISSIADQTINEDENSLSEITVSDDLTADRDLLITASSSNTTLVSANSVKITGTGSTRNVQVSPVRDQSGSAVITLTLSDGASSVTTSFTLTVVSVPDAPRIEAIASRTVEEDSPVQTFSVVVEDPDSPRSNLTYQVSHTNSALVNSSKLVLTPTASGFTLLATPEPNRFGESTITVTASDGVLTSSRSFTLAVVEVNDLPAISHIADQRFDEDKASATIPFTIDDVETAAGNLIVTAHSSNTGLIPKANITLGGTGANRTVKVKSVPNEWGSTRIRITVSDGTDESMQDFWVRVEPVNDAPKMSAIADQAINEDTSTKTLPFTVEDIDTSLSELKFYKSSSHMDLIPLGNIVLGGSGVNRTVKITPLKDRYGTSTIVLRVYDGHQSFVESFVVTVKPVNDAPTVTAIADQTINEDTSTKTLPFTVADIDTSVSKVKISKSSSDPNLIPVDNIVIGGSGASRTVKVTPAKNRSGTSTIVLKVDDGSLSSTETFKVTVKPVNDAPTVTAIADQTINEDTSTKTLSFKIDDIDTSVSKLKISKSSSDPNLIPVDNIVLGGSGAKRTVKVTPAKNRHGTATIALKVDDGSHSSTETFKVIVKPVNDAPTISKIAAQTVARNRSSAALAFTVGDAETAASSLKVTRSSSDTKLLPLSGIVLGGTGAKRTVKLTPAKNRTGTATVTLSVSDGKLKTKMAFKVKVSSSAKSLEEGPTITADLADQVVLTGQTLRLEVTSDDPAARVRWFRDDEELRGATTRELVLPKIKLIDAGGYRALLTNAKGQSTSRTAEVVVVAVDAQSVDVGSGRRLTGAVRVAGAADKLRLSLLLPADWRYVDGVAAGAQLLPQRGDVGLIEWQWREAALEHPARFTATLARTNSASPWTDVAGVLEIRVNSSTVRLPVERLLE